MYSVGNIGICHKRGGQKTSIQNKTKRYTLSERGMVNLSEIVINSINEACKMPEGLRGSPELEAIWP
jgi:hypothetical protein